MNTLVEIRNIRKKYGNKIILDIPKLNIEEGKIYGIVGKNGAGKTTLFRLLGELTFLTDGTIQYVDTDIKKGIIIEYPCIDLNMTAKENLIWAEKLYGEDICRNRDELLKLVKLDKHKDVKTKKYSLGMKQRLGIAMCLIHNPKLLILDEPMNGLDPEGIVELRNLLKDINKLGTTILISSHILDELYKLATDYVFIKNGKVVEQISQEEMELKNTSIYEMTTSDNERAVSLLEDDFYCSAKVEKGKVFFSVENKEILQISKSLAQKEIYITGLFENKFSIEEYYMEVLGD